jgi:hypothetical protein
MSYLGLIDKTAVKVATTTATKPPPPPPQEAPRATLLPTKMTTYAQVKPTVQQAATVVKPAVTAQPAPETSVTVTPQEVEVTTTQSAPSAAEMQTTVQATTKTSWIPWALGAAGLLWFYKKK